MNQGDVYIQSGSLSSNRPTFAIVERVEGTNVIFRILGNLRNSNWPIVEFNQEFKLATPKEFKQVIDKFKSSSNHIIHHLEDSLAKFRDSKTTIERLKDLSGSQDIMSKEEVLKEHLRAILMDTPVINIGSNANIVDIFSYIYSRNIEEEGTEIRGNVDLDSMNTFRYRMTAFPTDATPRPIIEEFDVDNDDESIVPEGEGW